MGNTAGCCSSAEGATNTPVPSPAAPAAAASSPSASVEQLVGDAAAGVAKDALAQKAEGLLGGSNAKGVAAAAAVGTAIGAATVGVFAAPVVGAGLAYKATQGDAGGDAARKVTEVGTKAFSIAKDLNDEYDVTGKTAAAAKDAAAWAEEHQVKEKAAAAAAKASEVGGDLAKVKNMEDLKEFAEKHDVKGAPASPPPAASAAATAAISTLGAKNPAPTMSISDPTAGPERGDER